MPSADYAARRTAFRKLHESGCFIIPNPWDVGTAMYLQHLGFKALATTSSGFAFTHGLPDGRSPDGQAAVPLDLALRHFKEVVESVGIPINADFQDGYAADPGDVASNVRLCVDTGVAGLSIEDATGDRERPLYEFDLAVARIKAARGAIDDAGSDVLLTGRAECFLVRHPDALNESIRRLQAYAEAGADVLYAPGLRTREDITAVVQAVAPKPVNVLMGAGTGLTLNDLAEMGVRRISVGGALARAAWSAFIEASNAMLEDGSFELLGGSTSFADLNRFFAERSSQ
jgi:2-methylisocitrate lyase-like PEP mutase family enzyme